MEIFELKKRSSDQDLLNFAQYLIDLSQTIGFKVSSRGWAYILEQERYINKDEFDKITNLINKCRKKGFLPIDFVAEEKAREFQGIETPSEHSVIEDLGHWLNGALNTAEHYNLDWWDNEEYYIQLVVEKIDLVTLFGSVCKEYHIPIANSKGWSSMLQRAEYARRFKEAEDKELKCVLLYCGDHDPDGLRISEFIKKNIKDLKEVSWGDGQDGYDPSNLIIKRFGLNYDFIQENNLTWIDNLITGSGKNLANPNHKNFKMPYVQKYLSEIGERKCEANAVVTMPDAAKEMAREAIEYFLGVDALDRFEIKRQAVRDNFSKFLSQSGLDDTINNALKLINDKS